MPEFREPKLGIIPELTDAIRGISSSRGGTVGSCPDRQRALVPRWRRTSIVIRTGLAAPRS